MSDSSFIVWKEEFSVGSETLDTQHVGMFDIINNLYSGMQHGLHQKQLYALLQELRQYAETHFADEERIMLEHNFPNFVQHQEAHQTYTQRIDNFLLQFQMAQGDLSFDVLKFLKMWLTNHILNMDKQYAPFISSEGKANNAMHSDGQGRGV